MSACGLDFGTSNSGVSLPAGASAGTQDVQLVPLEDGECAMPTAVFFGTEEPLATHYGRAAVRGYLDGTPGRLMRSLKSLLGSSLMEETTAVGDRNVRYVDIVTLYLRTLRIRASDHAGRALTCSRAGASTSPAPTSTRACTWRG